MKLDLNAHTLLRKFNKKWACEYAKDSVNTKNNKMASEEVEVDIEGFVEGEDLVDLKDIIVENTDVITWWVTALLYLFCLKPIFFPVAAQYFFTCFQ